MKIYTPIKASVAILYKLLFVFFLFFGETNAQVVTATDTQFRKFASANCRCELISTGNTVHTYAGAAVPGFHDRTSTFGNNVQTFVYEDVDANMDTFNSTTAGFTLAVGEEVALATLHWGGRVGTGAGAAFADLPNGPEIRTLKISFDGGVSYTDITPDIIRYIDSSGLSDYVTASFDITALMLTNRVLGGVTNVTIGNVPLIVRTDGESNIGGWMLNIVKTNAVLPNKEIAVYEGLIFGNNFSRDITIPQLAVPAGNTDPLILSFMTGDGDLGANDNVQVDVGDGSGLTNITDALHSTTDLLNTRSTYLGQYISDVAALPRNPNHDRDVVDLIYINTGLVPPGGGIQDVPLRVNVGNEGISYHIIAASVASWPRDFGDAPESYNEGIDDGAIHSIQQYDFDFHTAPLMIGSNVDVESVDNPTALATGDDTLGAFADDEDGITLPAQFIFGQPTTFTVDVTSARVPDSYLNVWADLNGDGDFNEVDEHILIDQVVATGNSTVNVNMTVPNNCSMPDVFVRARLCNDPATCNVPNGLAEGGEVEDQSAPVVFGPTVADTDMDSVVNLCDVDDDNDGILDIQECGPIGTVLITGFEIGDPNPTSCAGVNGISASSTPDFLPAFGVTNIYNGSRALGLHPNLSDATVIFEVMTVQLPSPISLGQRLDISVATANQSGTIGWTPTGTGYFDVYASDGPCEYDQLLFQTSNRLIDTGWVVESLSAVVTIPTVNYITFVPLGISSDPSVDQPYMNMDDLQIVTSCADTDSDGLNNDVDLDSDGDGCPDAVEGGDTILNSQLLPSSVAGGNTIGDPGFTGFGGSVSDNLTGNYGGAADPIAAGYVDANGQVVQVDGGVPPGTNPVAQTISESQDATLYRQCCEIDAPTLAPN